MAPIKDSYLLNVNESIWYHSLLSIYLLFTPSIPQFTPSTNQPTMSLIQRLPFFLHSLIEIPASLNFFFNPSSQLSLPAPQAHAVIQQYAILLFVSCLISIIFAWRAVDRTSRNVAGALSLYHIAPALRATGRILGGEGFGKGMKGLGGPWVHLMVHFLCCASLLRLFLSRRTRR